MEELALIPFVGQDQRFFKYFELNLSEGAFKAKNNNKKTPLILDFDEHLCVGICNYISPITFIVQLGN